MDVSGFLRELRRRKVTRVAVVYAATAFVLIQAADIMLPRLAVPDWAMNLIVVLVVVGFPVALVLGWALELTPDGVRVTTADAHPDPAESPPSLLGRRTVAVAGALVILGVALGAGWFLGSGASSSPGTAAAEDGGPPEDPSIAVLPFQNLSSDPENAFFADGLAEEVMNSLAGVPSLRVAGRTSSFYFKDRNDDPQTIGTRLGVGHLLDGSVQKSGDRIRVTVQLIEIAEGFHLWSETYDREMDDIFLIQDEIARAIVDALEVELGTGAPSNGQPTEDLAAYERLLEARTLITARGPGGLNRAIALLDEAVRLDPAFAPAWAALAQAHSLVYWYDVDVSRAASVARAEAAAERALELDPDLGGAHQVLGDVLRDRFEWEEAEASYLRALALDPNDVEANSQYAQMLGRLGLAERALPFATRAQEVDPLAAVPPAVVGLLLSLSGDREEGLRHVQRARSLSPDLAFFHMAEMAMQLDLGRFDAAVEAQRMLGEWRRGINPDDLFVELHELIRTQGEDPATILAHLRDGLTEVAGTSGIDGQIWALHYGDPELALEFMRAELRSDGRFDNTFIWLRHFVPMRRLEGFTELMREQAMPEYWKSHGWPDDCRPVGSDDFECGLAEGQGPRRVSARPL